LDPLDRNLQDVAFCAGRFIPRSLRTLVFDGGESAWLRLGSKDAELDCHLPLPKDQGGKGSPLDQDLQDVAFCAGIFIPRSLRTLVFDGGESAWLRLGSKDAELVRCRSPKIRVGRVDQKG
jgi:hypothetical protein